MESINFGGTIRGLSSIAGAKDSALNKGKPKSNERRPQPSNPAAAETPKEALAYIDLLYKTGRMEDLAVLLRGSKVFREAWLILQRSVATHSETSKEVNALSRRTETAGGSNFPIRSSAAITPPESVNYLNPAVKFTYSLTKALQVYKSQLRYYDHEKKSKFQISIRV